MTTKRLLVIFIAVVLAVGSLGLFMLSRLAAGSFSKWDDLQLFSDKEVRERIRDSGIGLPEGAKDLFYAISGFQDKGIWIKFSVPQDQVWQTVERALGKGKADFSTKPEDAVFEEPRPGVDQQVDLSWWNPSSVKKPHTFSSQVERRPQSKARASRWLVDEESGTVYVMKSIF